MNAKQSSNPCCLSQRHDDCRVALDSLKKYASEKNLYCFLIWKSREAWPTFLAFISSMVSRSL